MLNDLMPKRQRILWGLAVFLILIGIDQLAKNTANDVYRNYFFAFSLPLNVYVMYGIYFLGMGAIAVYLLKHYYLLPKAEFFSWVLILAGAASNVGERLFSGFVRDWVNIGNGVFNFADGYIIAGITILLLNSKFEYRNPKNIKI